ncbi:MAG: long-chain fatty acid--CoA ligase [Ignavibacteria bacterium]|nr:long-chain fatty acid--CoA ligase [Ignavibacteria bacterium]
MDRALSPTLPTRPATLNELLALNIERYPHPDMFRAKVDGRWKPYSSSEVAAIVRKRALGLYKLGIRHGDRVGLLSENSPDWVMCDYAILANGACTVPIYTTQIPEQVEYILSDADVHVLFVSSAALFERVKPILSHLKLNHIVILKPFAEGANIITMDELERLGTTLDTEDPPLITKLRAAVKADDLATIIYTSGTTGVPKGVMLTHRNLVSNAIDSSSVIDWNPDGDSVLSYLPLTHIFERTMINIYLYRGLPVSFAESIEALAQNLLDIRPTVMATVPRMLEKVFDKILTRGLELHGLKKKLFDWSIRLGERFDPDVPGSLWYRIQLALARLLVFSKWRAGVGGRARVFISGGAALAPGVQRVFLAAGIPIYQGYGLTETSPVIAVNRYKKNRLGAVGHPIPNTEVRIADDGEILVKGLGVMTGYYKMPEATAEVLAGEWLKTGDIGYIDHDGYLIITDRKKDLFKKSTGKFVVPTPIEAMLRESRYIEHAMVIGEGRKFVITILFPNFLNLTSWAKDRKIVFADYAELVAHPDAEALYTSEVERVNPHLNKWERIVKFILSDHELSIDEGLLTPTMKVRRREVSGKFAERIDAIYREYEHVEVHDEYPG